MKKNTSSALMSYATQSHAAGTITQMMKAEVSGAAGSGEKPPRQLYEVDTEKLLLSNDKVTVTELWKSNPQPSFPFFFLKLLNLEEALEQAQAKTQSLKNKIDKRKQDERRREEEKIEQAAKQREELLE